MAKNVEMTLTLNEEALLAVIEHWLNSPVGPFAEKPVTAKSVRKEYGGGFEIVAGFKRKTKPKAAAPESNE